MTAPRDPLRRAGLLPFGWRRWGGARIAIGPSPHGRGLFAVRPIRAHRVLGRVAGAIVRGADYESDYCIDLGPELALEPGPPFRFANHSCEPNCRFVVETAGAGGLVWFETLRGIAAGEELTVDYAWPADQAIPCGCGSRKCRGWITRDGEAWLPEQRAAHGAG